MILCFGKLLQNPNSVYFGASDDGLQAYYGAIYHVKYDTSYWHMNGMNYPYGEQVFFTGCQPFITNIIKLISEVVDISDFTVGIINLVMISSVFFCIFCLYWIFQHLRLSFWYSSIAAVGITFLSPQIFRLACHYSLTYQFAIPLFLLLLLKFAQTPSIKKSILISLLVFFMAGTHFYFFGFFAILSTFYWAVLFFSKKITSGNIKFTCLHVFVQLVLPYLIFQGLIYLIDDAPDRTGYPWGYLTYIANLAGVFYPSGKLFYETFFASFILPEYTYTMEGVAYVGLVALLVFVLLILILIKKVLIIQYFAQSKLMQLLKVPISNTISLPSELKKLIKVTDNKILNAFCWASVLALVLSFGYPFRIKGYEHWLDYIGLFRQMRGIARISWIFYYVINIIAFYKIYQWVSNKKAIWKNCVLVIALFLVCYDAYYNSYQMEQALSNPIARLADKENLSSENQWLNELKPNKYQAIITLPYFHVGSENLWMIHAPAIMGDVYITSLKTGLPTTSSLMSRTSLSQTFKNIQLIIEPYRKLEIVNDFKNKKPFLVLVRENELNTDEKKLLILCTKIKTTPLFDIYELPFEKIENISEGLHQTALISFNKNKTYNIEGFNYTDSMKTFMYNSYYQKPDQNYYEGKIKDYNLLFYDIVPNSKNEQEQEYTISFWMDNFTEDLYPRTTCVFECISDSTGVSYNREELAMWERVRVIQNNKALIEGRIKIKNKKDRLGITIWHNNISNDKKMFRADQLLIKPIKDTIYKITDQHSIMVNNRIYIKK